MSDVSKQMTHPILVLVRGIPGSGKSYLAAAVQAALGADRAVVLDPDATDYDSDEYRAHSQALSDEGVDEKFHPYRFVRAQAYRAIEANQVVMWTQAFTNLDGFQKTIVNLENYAKEHGTDLPLLVVEIEVSEATARARATEREKHIGRSVSDEAFERFLSDYTSFAHHGYNTVTIDGEGSTEAAVSAVVAAIEDLS